MKVAHLIGSLSKITSLIEEAKLARATLTCRRRQQNQEQATSLGGRIVCCKWVVGPRVAGASGDWKQWLSSFAFYLLMLVAGRRLRWVADFETPHPSIPQPGLQSRISRLFLEFSAIALAGAADSCVIYENRRPASVYEIDGSTNRVWSYTWTGDDLTRIDLPDGRALEYSYTDGSHPGFMTLTELIGDDGTSRRVTAGWEYDAWGNAVKIWKGATTFAAGIEKWQFLFDDPLVPRSTVVTDPLGNTATYVLDRVRASRVQKAKLIELQGDCPSCGVTPNTRLQYQDAANPFRVTREIDARNIETRSSWNIYGQLDARIEAFGTPAERTTIWTYDATFPALWTSIEQESTSGAMDFRRTERGFDGSGRLISETIEGIETLVPFSLVTVYTPTSEGMTGVIDPPGYGTADRTSFTYDPARGNLVADTRTDPLIGTTHFGYDPFNRGTSVTDVNGYDCNGNVARVWDANHPSAGQTATPSTSYTYDQLDRLQRVRQPFGGPGGGNADTDYEYDVQDHLVKVTDANGTVTSYVYSDRDLMTREISEVSGTSNYTFNEHRQLTIHLDARGITTTRTVDALDRVTSVDLPGSDLDVVFTYDDPLVAFSKGRLTRITRDETQVDYAYDLFGRTIQDGGIGYTFDKNGNAETVTYPGGLIATYAHDHADRPATSSVTPAGGSPQAIVTAANHRPSGPISSLSLGNGLTETRNYDSRDYPARILVPGKLDWNYTVDAVGNPTAIADALVPANNKSFNYQNYQYFLTTGNGPWGTRSWTYDKIGNRLTETRSGVTDSYTYVANAATGRSPKIQQIALGGGGTHAFTYDSAGNETQAGSSTRVFDDAGRLGSQTSSPAQATSAFIYDGRGFLAQSIGNAPAVVGSGIFCDGFESGSTSAWGGAGSACFERIVTRPTYGSEGRLYQVQRGGRSESVLYFEERPVGTVVESTEGTAYGFLTTDHLGTPVLATTIAAATTWSGGFEPFGKDWNGAQAAEVFLRYPGQWSDVAWSKVDSNLLQNLARWYQNDKGRYSSPDPLNWITNDLEFYTYAKSSPFRFTDPTGLMAVKCENCIPLLIAKRNAQRRIHLLTTLGTDTDPDPSSSNKPSSATICQGWNPTLGDAKTFRYLGNFQETPCQFLCESVHERKLRDMCSRLGTTFMLMSIRDQELPAYAEELKCLNRALKDGNLSLTTAGVHY